MEKLTPHAEVASVGVVSETSFEGYIASQRVVSLGFGSFYSLPGILHDGFLQGDHDDVGDDEEGDPPGDEVLHVEVVEGISPLLSFLLAREGGDAHVAHVLVPDLPAGLRGDAVLLQLLVGEGDSRLTFGRLADQEPDLLGSVAQCEHIVLEGVDDRCGVGVGVLRHCIGLSLLFERSFIALFHVYNIAAFKDDCKKKRGNNRIYFAVIE